MEMTKRERRAARAFDDSRPPMKHDVRSIRSLERTSEKFYHFSVAVGVLAVLAVAVTCVADVCCFIVLGGSRGGVKNKETRGGRTKPHTTAHRGPRTALATTEVVSQKTEQTGVSQKNRHARETVSDRHRKGARVQ